ESLIGAFEKPPAMPEDIYYEENMEKNDREKGEILNKCGNLEIRIAENNNCRSHRVISGYRPITGNDKRSNL
ncbi:hypothetical protein, partial [Escherichia coli]|uniref:hypothetical protein n=4 Tax=Escherichia coli TaxID=562 RepID=UPI000E1CCF18